MVNVQGDIDVPRSPDVGRVGHVGVGMRPGLVRRRPLIAHLQASTDVPVVLVAAGAGFGKTTLISQWLYDDPRPVAWLALSKEHDDPVALLGAVLHALDSLEPFEPRALQDLLATSLDFTSVLLPRLERAVATRARPFVLVLDDAHLLHRRKTWAVVRALADCTPPGAQLVLASRTKVPLPVSRLATDHRLVTIDGASLAMNTNEAAELFAAAGIYLDDQALDLLVQRTEGWPAGLYFASLAIGESTDRNKAAAQFAGDDRLVADYFRDEFLSKLPRQVREFLVDASVLDQLSAPACDAVLDSDDSEAKLRHAAQACLFLIPLDRRDTAYRIHPLLRAVLCSELHRQDPNRERTLHERASMWCENAGNLDAAIAHASSAGDNDRVETLIWRATPLFAGAGRTATVEDWLTVFSHDTIAARSPLTVSQAWCRLTAGDLRGLAYWTEIASHADPQDELPDGSPVGAAARLLRAVLAQRGIHQMQLDAARAYELHRPGSPYRGVARFLEGCALRILGRRVEARARLEDGVAIGELQVPAVDAQCRAQLADMAADDGDWDEARRMVDHALATIERFELRGRPDMALTFCTGALVHARTSTNPVLAREEAERATLLVSMLTTVGTWAAIDARISACARGCSWAMAPWRRSSPATRAALLDLVPDRELFEGRLTNIELAADAEPVPIAMAALPLTPAEMRVLRYLPTRLGFAAIAEELYLSRHTVKAQAISAYRKLGVNSRDAAVAARASRPARGVAQHVGTVETSTAEPEELPRCPDLGIMPTSWKLWTGHGPEIPSLERDVNEMGPGASLPERRKGAGSRRARPLHEA